MKLDDLRGAIAPNLRQTDRYLAERSVQISYRGADIDAWLVECSKDGIGMVCPVELAVGQTLVLKVAAGNISTAAYAVRYCTKLWDRAYQVGARRQTTGGDDADGEAILQTLLAPEIPPQCS